MVVVSKGRKNGGAAAADRRRRKRRGQTHWSDAKPGFAACKAGGCILKMDVHHESDRYDIMATSSVIALVALFDALQVAIMEETDYKLEQFALIHRAAPWA